MSKAKEIFEGFLNLMFHDQEVEALAKKRLKVCFECPVRTGSKCDKAKGGCNCLLSAKTRSPNSSCPLKKW